MTARLGIGALVALALAPAPAPARAPEARTAAAEPAALDVRVVVPRVSARKANRRKRITVQVTSPELVHALSAQLLENGRRVARGWLAQLEGTRRLRLRLTEHMRRGPHELLLSASLPSGEPAQRTVRVRVRR